MTKAGVACVVVGVLFGFAAPASAVERNVVPAGGSATDPDCTTVVCTLKRGVDVAVDGDTVKLAPGAYSLAQENVSTSITIAGDPTGARPTVTSPNDAPFLLNVPNITFRHIGVIAQNGFALDTSGGFGNEAPGLLLDDVLTNAPNGITLGRGGTIRNSVIRGGGPACNSCAALTVLDFREIDAAEPSPTPAVVTLRGSTIVGSGSNSKGLILSAACEDRNNFFRYSYSNVDARNLLIRGAVTDIRMPDATFTADCPTGAYGASLDIDYSNFRTDHTTTGTNPPSVITAGAHNQTDGADLNLVDAGAGDYRETAASPTVNAGSDADMFGAADFYGHPRKFGASTDIGAAEFVPPPAAFDLSLPAENATVAAAPTLNWSTATGAAHYDLVIDGVVNRQNISLTSTTPTASLSNGAHTWKVIAYNPYNDATESTSTRTFTVDAIPPGAFDLASPADGAALASSSPTLSWSAASGVDHYDVVIDGVVNRQNVTGTSTTPLTALTDGSHSWKVVALDSVGNATDSTSTRTFTVDATPPGGFDLASPANGGTVNDASPSLSWSAASAVDHYDVVIDGVVNRQNVTGTSTTPVAPLVDGPHTWKVVALDSVGNSTDSTSTRTFTVDTAPPGGGGQPATISLGKAVNGRRGSLTYPVTVSGAGTLTGIAASSEIDVAARGSSSPGASGTSNLLLKPTKAGKKLLRRHGKLRVTVTISFQPASGEAVQAQTTAKLKLKRR